MTRLIRWVGVRAFALMLVLIGATLVGAALLPRGPQLSFVGQSPGMADGLYDVFLYDIWRGATLQVTTGGEISARSPLRWSPDGHYLIVTRRSETEVVVIDDRGRERLTVPTAPYLGWTPDGCCITAQLDDLDTPDYDPQYTLIDIHTGTEQTQPLAEPWRVPSWSPDGRWIRQSTREGILGYDTREGETRLLVPAPETFNPGEPIIGSPTGDHIAIPGHTITTGVPGLLIASLTGDEWIIPDAGIASWSPDGEALAYGLDRGIHIFELATGDSRTLTDGLWPDWSPDGGLILLQTLDEDWVTIHPSGGRGQPIHSPIEPIFPVWRP